MVLIFGAIIGWIVCGFIHYGLFVGCFQDKFGLDIESDRRIARITAMAGPFALITTLVWCTPYHWKL